GTTATETPLTLPALEDSDTLFREKVTALSPELAPWLKSDHLIENGIVIINDFAEGQRLAKHMRTFKLQEAFVADSDEQGLYVPGDGYRRYDPFVAAIDAISIPEAVALYTTFKPLARQVFDRFDYPADYDVDDIVKKATAEILAAPVIESRINLIRTSVNYKFADPKLEALSPVQKQMLRMGPRNTRILQNKLRLLLEVLVNPED
ncbi:MAG: DUF3014 domain-containing protein, partial [Gammaproteobacteria bacterium]